MNSKNGTFETVDSYKINGNIGNFDSIKSDNINIQNTITQNLESNNGKFNTINASEANINKLTLDELNLTKPLDLDNINIGNNLNLVLLNSDQIISKKISCDSLTSDTNIFKNTICDDLQTKNFLVVSDKRKKNTIKYNNINSEYLDHIQQATFKYNNDNKEHIGFIAQDIQKYYPELVHTDENGFLSVKYVEMIPLLLNYNKSMKKELKDELDKLKSFIDKNIKT